jgi:hypothetical protein
MWTLFSTAWKSVSSVLQHAALLQVFEQRGDGLFAFARQPAGVDLDFRANGGRSGAAGPVCRGRTGPGCAAAPCRRQRTRRPVLCPSLRSAQTRRARRDSAANVGPNAWPIRAGGGIRPRWVRRALQWTEDWLWGYHSPRPAGRQRGWCGFRMEEPGVGVPSQRRDGSSASNSSDSPPSAESVDGPRKAAPTDGRPITTRTTTG